MADRPTGRGLDEWLTALGREPGFAGVAASREEQRLILELARIAAHRSERIAAPITTYLAGLALARLDPAERARRLEELVGALERRSD